MAQPNYNVARFRKLFARIRSPFAFLSGALSVVMSGVAWGTVIGLTAGAVTYYMTAAADPLTLAIPVAVIAGAVCALIMSIANIRKLYAQK